MFQSHICRVVILDCFYIFVVELDTAPIRVMEGQNVILRCPRRQVDWRLDGLPIYMYTTGEITKHYRARFTFESRNKNEGHLVVTGIAPEDNLSLIHI